MIDLPGEGEEPGCLALAEEREHLTHAQIGAVAVGGVLRKMQLNQQLVDVPELLRSYLIEHVPLRGLDVDLEHMDAREPTEKALQGVERIAAKRRPAAVRTQPNPLEVDDAAGGTTRRVASAPHRPRSVAPKVGPGAQRQVRDSGVVGVDLARCARSEHRFERDIPGHTEGDNSARGHFAQSGRIAHDLTTFCKVADPLLHRARVLWREEVPQVHMLQGVERCDFVRVTAIEEVEAPLSRLDLASVEVVGICMLPQ